MRTIATLFLATVLALGFPAARWARADPPDPAPRDAGLAPGRFAGNGLVVGLEYAVLDNPRLVRGMAAAFAETGLPGMKHYAEAVEWGAMQKGPNLPIDFTRLDWFVREYQAQGFTDLTLCLKPHSHWGSKHVPLLGPYTDPSPKSEHRQRYADWVAAVVERYDGDGQDDMPGLRWPVRWVEIGSEFSSYEPEPVAEYLDTLALAYAAAHRASPDVRVGHAAFLVTPVDLDVKDPADYERAWAAADLRDRHHGLADLRAVLDRPELFDFINLHNLGCPSEIEHAMKWLGWETGARHYAKPVVISDTVPTSYVGWGPATVAQGKKLGAIAAPAVEADRPRLAAFFRKLVGQDPPTLAWTRGFVAADHVQRTIVAAEQGVKLINLSFTGDLPLLTLPLFQAGAGISAWGGAARFATMTGAVEERYPLFFALRQMMGHLQGYEAIERVRLPEARARVYGVRGKAGRFWVAWHDPGRALLPEDGQPAVEVALPVGPGMARVAVEGVITRMGQTQADRQVVAVQGGVVRVTLTPTPVYVVPE